VVWLGIIFSTLWFYKYWILNPDDWEPPAPPTAAPYEGLDPRGLGPALWLELLLALPDTGAFPL